jgi:hypothetical protein
VDGVKTIARDPLQGLTVRPWCELQEALERAGWDAEEASAMACTICWARDNPEDAEVGVLGDSTVGSDAGCWMWPTRCEG